MKISSFSIPHFLTCAVVSFVTLLFFSGSTSPLFNIDFSDGLVFQYVAAGLNHGQLPYIDIFDHKGPFLYFINYVGLSLGGRYGIFCLQWVNMTLTLYLCVRFCVQQHLRHSLSLVLFIIMNFLVRFMSEGDMTEEWSVLFLAIPMFPLLQYMMHPQQALSRRQLFVLGLCAGLVSLLRLNNVAPLLGLFLWWLILEVRQKHYLYLVKILSWALVGFLLPVSIACGWFYCRAGSHGLYELFYANVLFNLEYAGRPWPNDVPLWKQIGVTFFHLVVLLYALIRCYQSPYRKLSIGLASAYVLTVLTMGCSWFSHYQMILIPVIVVTLFLLSHLRMRICLMLLLASSLYWNRTAVLSSYVHYTVDNDINHAFQLEFADLVGFIPSAEQTQSWNLNVNGAVDAFLRCEVYPQSRFCCAWHRFYAQRFIDEEADAFRRKAPSWVFVEEAWLSEIPADSLFLMQNYHKVCQTSCAERAIVSLYRHNP